MIIEHFDAISCGPVETAKYVNAAEKHNKILTRDAAPLQSVRVDDSRVSQHSNECHTCLEQGHRQLHLAGYPGIRGAEGLSESRVSISTRGT